MLFQKNLLDRNFGHKVLYAGGSSAEFQQELLSWKVLRPCGLVGVGRWRMHTEVEQRSWTSGWVSLVDFFGFVCVVEHVFRGADVKLSADLTCSTSSRC